MTRPRPLGFRRLVAPESLESKRMLTATPVPADVNGDGVVAPGDALIVLNHLGTDDVTYDLDNDGIVAGSDTQLVIDSLPADTIDALLAAPCQDPSTPALASGASAIELLLTCGCDDDEVPDYVPDYPGDDPNDPPDGYTEWRGDGPPGSSEGAWYNPDTGESLHPDIDNQGEGPHWDYNYPGPPKEKWRVFKDGRKEKDCS